MKDTEIGWCHHTINFWMGCHHVSKRECAGCYADTMMSNKNEDFNLLRLTKGPWYDAEILNARAKAIQTHQLVFTCSMSDFFHKDADIWRDEAWDVIRRCRNLIWLILTKRPERIINSLPADWAEGSGYPHVWLGTTCGEHQSFGRIDQLRAIPCQLRFLSCEPLIEELKDINLDGIGWVLCGGMSGKMSEPLPMDIHWAAALYDSAKEAKVPFLFKQISAKKPERGINALGMYLEGRNLKEVDPAVVSCIREYPECELNFNPPQEKGERFNPDDWLKYHRSQCIVARS